MNPFNQVYNALWELVERNPTLSTLIPYGNRIKFKQTPYVKEEVSFADFPELVLMPAGGLGEYRSNSSASKIVRKYAFGIANGSYELEQYENIAWELFRALVDWDQVLCRLTWPTDTDRNYIIKCSSLDISEGLDIGEQRGLHSWAGVWGCEVEMCFNTLDLRIKTQEYN